MKMSSSPTLSRPLPATSPRPSNHRTFDMALASFMAISIGLFFGPMAAHAEVAGITSGDALQAEANKRVAQISTSELRKLIDEEPELVLVDIRMPGEVRNMGGAIKAPQNVNIPRGWLEFNITRHAQSKDTPIVVYCGANFRSPLAAETLTKMGYTNVRNYGDGYIGWRKAGLPISKPE